MKKTFNLLFVLSMLSASFFTSCSSCSSNKEKTREESVAEFRSTLNHEDTTQMLKLCDDAMAQLKGGQVEEVLRSLYEYNDSTKEAKPLTKQTADRYRKRFRMFPVLVYTRQFFSFQLEGCNDVRYNVTWAKAEQTGTGSPAKTAYMFNPVKVDGSWKLCVKTQADETDPDMR